MIDSSIVCRCVMLMRVRVMCQWLHLAEQVLGLMSSILNKMVCLQLSVTCEARERIS